MPPIMPMLEAAAAAACASRSVRAASGSGGGESWKEKWLTYVGLFPLLVYSHLLGYKRAESTAK